MVAIESNNKNFFSTTLTAGISASDLTIPVAALGGLSGPAYIVIDPKSDTKREVVYADGLWTGTNIVLSATTGRGLDGSAAGAQSHSSGTLVVSVPLAQHLTDLHDRVDQHTHDGTTADARVSHTALDSLTSDDHPQYVKADGTRAFTATPAGLDHGAIGGLGDDDHPQYVKADGTRAFTGTVSGVTPTANAHLATKAYADGVVAGLRQVVTFTASGTFTKATYPWLRAIRVRAVGGGGGGGGASQTTASTASGGGSGGGGEYREYFTTDIASLGASISVTVGAGGTGGGASGLTTANPGDPGTTTSFGTLVTAGGGGGGGGSLHESAPRASSGAGGIGGTGGSGGYVAVRGTDGEPAVLFTDRMAVPAGGSTPLSPQRSSGVTVTGAAGSAGHLYGGGGLGAINTANQSARAGGDGASGIVIVELYD